LPVRSEVEIGTAMLAEMVLGGALATQHVGVRTPVNNALSQIPQGLKAMAAPPMRPLK